MFQDFICQHLLCPAAFAKNNTVGQSTDPLRSPLTLADRSYLDWMALTNFHIRPQHSETRAGHRSRALLHLKVTVEWFKVLLLDLFLFILLIEEVQDVKVFFLFNFPNLLENDKLIYFLFFLCLQLCVYHQVCSSDPNFKKKLFKKGHFINHL